MSNALFFTRCRCAAAAAAAAQEAALRLRAEVSEVEERSGDHVRALLTDHQQVLKLGAGHTSYEAACVLGFEV